VIRPRVAAVGLGLAAGLALGAGAATSACSSPGPTGASPFVDGSTGGLGDGATAGVVSGEGGTLMSFDYPADPGPDAVYVTISGESNAVTGYPFPPSAGTWGSATYMVDGWEFSIQEYIVNVDKIVLWSNPNKSPTQQSERGDQQVAHLDGPFVVDLHKGGKIQGQGGPPEEATPLGVITSQNDNGGAAFATDGTTYGFGFSTVQATYDAYNVNLDSSEAADFDLMVEKGYSVLYVGMARWKGDDPSNPYGCTTSQAGGAEDAGLVQEGDAEVSTYADGGYDFTPMDQLTFAFKLGFATPTSYVNCQNMTLQQTPNPGEDYPRGLAFSPSESTIAQVTVHMDHPFWESFEEDTPVHWDDIAAQYVGSTANPVPVRTEDFVGVRFHPWFDSTGTPLPWRNCSGSNYSPPGSAQMFFSTLSVPIDPQGACTGTIGQDYTQAHCPAIRDYFDYIRFTQSTQGHLNSQGLCFIDRQYPAPAGGS
jgi:hypothetical protein